MGDFGRFRGRFFGILKTIFLWSLSYNLFNGVTNYKILLAILEVISGLIIWDFKSKPPSVFESQPVLQLGYIVEKVLAYKLL